MPSPGPIRPDDSGSPLDPGVRRVLEYSFGTDLSGIRVWSDTAAAALLRSHRLSAAAAGHQVFLPGRRPGEGERWLRLAAHEAAHSVQQAQGISARGPAQERQADRAADAAVAGRPFFRAGLEPPRAGHGARVLAGFDSWEHRLLGDVPGPDLAAPAARSAHGKDVAAQLLVGAIRQDTDGIRLYRAGVDSTGFPRISALDVAAMYAGSNNAGAWISQPLLQAGGAPVAATTPVNVLVAGSRLFAGVNGVVCELNPASGLVTGRWQPVPDSQTEVRMASDGFALYCGTASPTAPHIVAYDLLS